MVEAARQNITETILDNNDVSHSHGTKPRYHGTKTTKTGYHGPHHKVVGEAHALATSRAPKRARNVAAKYSTSIFAYIHVACGEASKVVLLLRK